MARDIPFARCTTLILLLACALFARPAAALDLTFHNAHPEGCIATASGQIETGDTAKLRAAFPGGADFADYVVDTPRLCLDSPGGSFLEGLEMARFLREAGISTYVGANATCLSACAIAFLGGSAKSFEDALIDSQSRAIHTTARLGFHAPQLDVPDTQFNRTQVQRAFTIAMRSASLIFSRLAELRITDRFALDFFAVEGGEFYVINRPSRLADLGATLEGFAPLPTRLSDAAVERICAFSSTKVNRKTFSAAHNGHAVLNTAIYDLPDQPNDKWQSRAFVLGWSVEGYRQWNICQVRWRGGPDPSLSVMVLSEPFVSDDTRAYNDPTPPSTTDIASFLTGRGGVHYSPSPWLAYPDDTRLSTLKGNGHGFSRKTAASTLCAPILPRYSVGLVQNFATLRQAPNFDAPVLREVAKNASVSPAGQGFSTTSPRCIRACDHAARQSVRTETLSLPANCKASNELWWHVRAPGGTQGWMSAKYLFAPD